MNTPTITSIEPSPRDPDVCRVGIAGRAAVNVPATEVHEMGLRPGQPWTLDVETRVTRAQARYAATKDALRILERRAYAAEAIVERLLRRGHDEDTARHAVDALVDQGWIDDHAFAHAYATELIERQPAGRDVIIERLRQRHIATDVAEAVADDVLAERPPEDAAVAFAQKRLRAMPGASNDAAARRIAGSLARRGVDEDTIITVLRSLDLPTE